MTLGHRLCLGSIVILLAVSLTPTTGLAAISSSVSSGTLVVNGDKGANLIEITCPSGDVLVTGSNPGTGAATCASITSIAIDGREGDDNINLLMVSAGTFTGLGAGDVEIVGGPGGDLIAGSAFADLLNSGGGDDSIFAQGGDDTVNGGGGSDQVWPGGAAQQTVILSDTQLFTETTGTDSLNSIERAVLQTWNGTIDASAFSGSTSQEGGDAADVMIGGSGSDLFYPSTGDNSVSGRGGADRFMQTLDASGDSVSGGGGTDTVVASGANMLVSDTTLQTSTGIDTLAGIERAELTAAAFSSIDAAGFTGPTVLTGTGGDETLNGGSGPDVIDGKNGNDTLRGRAGDDTLLGGGGDDTIIGGGGTDTCHGGPGANTVTGCE